MPKLRVLLCLFILFSLTACSVTPYQAAQKNSDHNYSAGYLQEELSPGVFVIEVQGSSFLVNKEQGLLRMQDHWKTRAKEICPHGYRGESDIIAASQAQIEQFRCTTESCKNRPLVSGIVWCNQRYYL